MSLVVFGAGGHAVSIAETARAAGESITYFVDEFHEETVLLGLPVHKSVVQCISGRRLRIAVAIGENTARERVVLRLRDEFPDAEFPALVHPSASISQFANIGEGAVVLQGAVIGAGATIGRFAIVNSRASVDHETEVGDFASLAPSATTGGRVRIGRRAALMMGAVVQQGITIGADSVVGAMSFVRSDLPKCVVAYGIPATVIRRRDVGERYLL